MRNDRIQMGGSASASLATPSARNQKLFQTLEDPPPAVFDYRLGNRSALDWVIDQYRITEDARSGIRSDPNRADDPEYIVRLIGQVVRVSLETVRVVQALPEQFAPTSEGA